MTSFDQGLPPDDAAPQASSEDRLPTMADIDSLATSLDKIDQTLAELDQPRVPQSGS